jgi:YidC/Oxa1 family membrane protein insertase
MSAVWQGILQGLGEILAFFYDVIPSYGVAIILLTVLVRILLLPLGIRQVRSMHAMQKLQPKVKELQRKHKGNRQKLNEELQKLYKEHQVNPLGGCLPLLLQIPVFIALYSVLQTPIYGIARPSSEITLASIGGEDAICLVSGEPTAEIGAVASDTIICDRGAPVTVEKWVARDDPSAEIQPSGTIFSCRPAEGEGGTVREFVCESAKGTRHLPPDSTLMREVVPDRATFLGMHLSCSPTQAASETGIRQCARPGTEAGGPPLIGYFGLVALMVVTTWYSQRQMQRAPGTPQQQQQMQLMGRIMPLFLGFISINISAGVLVYWVTTNLWQIGQQYVMIRTREPEAAVPAGKGGGSKPSEPKGGAAKTKGQPSGDGSGTKRSGGRGAGSRKKRRKR